MTSDEGDVGPNRDALTPQAAFAKLGDETRLGILETLGRADGPLSFAELRRGVGYDTSGNFSYHLDQLDDHFVRRTDDGYALRAAGRRVVRAVLAGTVTDAPRVERTRIDRGCPYCDAPVELRYAEERLEGYCSECDGVYDDATLGSRDVDDGYLGHLPLPPAGVQDRTMREAARAAWTWGFQDVIAIAKGVCPSCAAALAQDAVVCDDHDSTDGRCAACGNRHAVQVRSTCTNCIREQESAFVVKLLASTELLAFVTTHGLDPVDDQWAFGWTYDEDVRATEPFDASFTFTIDGDSLTLDVDEDLAVVDHHRH
jgi:hypothetical protein